jgi:hypothetical protein
LGDSNEAGVLMADAILVSLAKAVATALQAATFDLTVPDIDWDLEGRTPEELTDDTFKIVCNVPKRFDAVARVDRDSLGYVASVDIDILRKFSVSAEDYSQAIDRDELSAMIRLTEQVHQYFHDALSEKRLTLADHGLIAEWIDERDGVQKKSEVLIAYHPKFLTDLRQYCGVCREVFELTEGTA